MKKKILITGVNGFVGNTIASCLSSAYHVIGIGRKEKLNSDIPVEYYCADITQTDNLNCVFESTHPDIVVHCAASISCDNLALELIDTNVRGMDNIIKTVQKQHLKKFIYISSLPVIGIPQECPITENHPVYPRTTYHLTKYFGELLLGLVAKEMDIITLRLPSPVGVGMPNNKILAVFIDKCLKDENITLQGKGGRMQNYIDVRDIARAVECAIESAACGIFNIAAGCSYSNLELAQLCKSVLCSGSDIVFDGVDADEDIKWIYSTQKAEHLLHFTAQIPLERTIKEIAQSIR